MVKTFSTKLNSDVIDVFDEFCQKYHFKKSQILEEIILEAVARRKEAMEFAKSLQRGLEDESRGDLYLLKDVEAEVFSPRKAR